jgi:PAS domain S-box-containing protein
MLPGADAVTEPLTVDCASADDLLRQVVNHAPVVLWAMDRDGIVTLSVGKGLQALGLQPGELIGQSVFELYRDRPQILDNLRRVLQGEEQALLADVGTAFMEGWIRPLYNPIGEVIGAVGVATDVTDRVRAQRAERDSTARFLKAFHASPAGILLTVVETGEIIDVNAAFSQLSGVPHEELIGRTTLEMGFWQSAEQRWQMLSAVGRGESAHNPAYRLQLRDGRRLLLEHSIEPVDIDGRPCALSILRDISERRRYERALRRSRRRYQTLARFAPVGMFRMTHTGEWVYANGQCRRLLGCDLATLRGRGWLEAFHPDDRPQLFGCWHAPADDADGCRREIRTWSVSAAARWLLMQWEPQKGGRPSIGTLTDITHRKLAEIELQSLNRQLEEHVRMRTELLLRTSKTLEEQIHERRRTYQELERSEARWRSLVEDAPDVILQLNRLGQIEFINHANWRDDLTVDQVLGRQVQEFVAPEYVSAVEQALASVFEQGESVTQEVRGLTTAGHPVWYQSHLAPLWQDGQVVGATVVVRDITDQQRSAEELEHKQSQLAHVARVSMVGEMTAGFAHELNQPLAAIAHYIGGCVIRLQKESHCDPEVIATLQDAANEARRASEVVRRLRQFLHQHEIQREMGCLNQVVRDAARLIESTLHKQDVRCEFHLAETLPEVFMDRIQVMQVLLNLLLNAVEAQADLPVDRRLVIVTTGLTDRNWACCSVRDTGPGLPQGLGHDIFDAFVTTKPEGLGLGLSISRSIMQAHGGSIRAQNHPDGGAEFVLTFSNHSPGD